MSENSNPDTATEEAAKPSSPPSPPPTGGSGGGARIMFGIIGVIVAFVIVVLLNLIAPFIPGRIDFTENDRHTLSEGTKTILDKLDTEVQIKFYVSQGSEEKVPSTFLSRVREVEGLLREYKRNGNGKIKVQKINPQPDTEEEYNAQLAGIARTQFPPRDEAYFGIAISCLDQSVALPAIAGISEEQFEYHLTRTISQVYNPKKKVVGMMSALPLQGNMMTRQQPSILFQQLEQDYDVQMIDVSAEKIEYTDEDDEKKSPDLLVLLHPAGITEKAQYAIDQYILSGKNVVMFLDPFNLEAANSQPQQPMMPGRPPMGGGIPPSSTVETLLSKWGLSFNANQVIADRRLLVQGAPPTLLQLDESYVNNEDPVTEDAKSLMFVLAGGFNVQKLADGLKMTMLAETSESNQLVEPQGSLQNREGILADFQSSGTKKTLALRLAGTFKSAFDGPLKDDEEEDDDGDDEEEEEVPVSEEEESSHLAEGTGPAAVYLFGDSDFMSAQFALSRGFGMSLANHNLPVALNAIEQASGDSALIAIRSRASSHRPFTKINEIEEAAEEDIVDRIKTLNERVDEIGQQTMTLKQNKDGSLGIVMTEEDRKRRDELLKEKKAAMREIRDLRIAAKRKVTSTLNWIKGRNIIGMPLLIALVGICVALYRKVSTGAK
jgi:ABC-type uncharacterized transport system involved in gliding motility auxiliary subunit